MGHSVFPTTHWSVVVAAGESAETGANLALERLCRDYWQPVYAFVRRSGVNPEDARDLTQGFFADLLRGDSLERANPARGRFRSYLLGALKHFMADEYDRSQALKRGGGMEFVPIDAMLAESRYGLELASESAPAAYDRAWALAVLDRALTRLREEFALSGRAVLFDGLKPFLIGDRGDPAASSVATQYKIAALVFSDWPASPGGLSGQPRQAATNQPSAPVPAVRTANSKVRKQDLYECRKSHGPRAAVTILPDWRTDWTTSHQRN
jgi:RNA polymerase sigma-70 factor (ECF subfamily)